MPAVNLTSPATFGLLFYGLYKLIRQLLHFYFSALRDIPGPKSNSFIFGHAKDVQRIEDSTLLHEWVGQYGKIIKIKLFLGREAIVIMDTKAVNHILTHSMDFQKPGKGRRGSGRSVRFLGNGVLAAEGNKHRQQRRVMNPSFAPASIKALTPIFFQKSWQLRDIIRKLVAENPSEPVEVLTWLSRTTLDVIGLAGFDYHFDALSVDKEPNELSQAFTTLFHANRSVALLDILQAYFPILQHLPTRRERGRKKAMDTMNRIGRELVEERKNAVLGEKRNSEVDRGHLVGRDLLSALVQANMDTELPDNQRISDEDVLAQVPTFLIAGHETTSTETMWALFALAQASDVQQKLRVELRGAPADELDMDELNALPYLDMVVRETLRLHAAVNAVSRIAEKDDVIPLLEPYTDTKGVVRHEIRVNKGDRVIIPILALNVLKEIWGEDASEFKPERWLNPPEAVTQIPGVWGHMMTFLGGARGCIGYRFALIEMKVLLFTLLRNFEFKMSVPAESFEKRSFVVSRPYLKSDTKAGAQMPLIVRAYKEQVEVIV